STIESGIPDNHFLILTSTSVDKRKKIFKTIKETGCVIDCSVAQGNRKADLEEQHKVLHKVAMQVLSRTNKTIDRRTFMQLADLTGFNLDLLVQNLEKLAAYTGNRPAIVPEDLKAVIQRDKKDPVFNLTNAFLDKNLAQSLFYLESLLKEGYHPLQILKSMENQIRRLLMVKSFLKTVSSNSPVRVRSMNFNNFKQSLLPQIVQYDQKLKAFADASKFKNINSPSKKNETVDVLLAPNPKNAYPVYQTFLKSEHFSLTELQDIMIYLSDLDFRLKTSSADVRITLEYLLINTCSKGGFVYAAENKDHRHHF
ncbi:MAG: DNA polymerase III subunit delta, partial [Desulfobacterales bacterium]|nr:DNA polymerase III subunit delta [Desulfobacterales bacterium]